MAERIPEELMEELTERKDKFISNVYKAKIDHFILMVGGEPPTGSEPPHTRWWEASEAAGIIESRPHRAA